MKKTSFKILLILSVISGILLSIPFIMPSTGIISFVAFLPLFAAEYLATRDKVRHFWICYFTTFIVWNTITTYWIWYATQAGAVAAIILNSLQMAIIFRIFRWSRKRSATLLPYLLFAFLWCGWEHFYQTWQVTWPWLTLGNGFADSIKHIQWYEVTGTIGGSLWILLVNILLFRAVTRVIERRRSRWFAIAALALAVIPSVISHIRFYTYKTESPVTKQVTILQPNIDPYGDKFGGLTQSQQNDILFMLADSSLTDTTFLVVAPETFFNPSESAGVIMEGSTVANATLQRFQNLAAEKNTNVIFGAVTHKFYPTPSKPTRSARASGPSWYDVFNTAIFLTPEGGVSYHHKSKLVILAETIPYIGNKSVFGSLGIDLGGGIGNYGVDPYRTIFHAADNVNIGTAVCYESVFGDYFRDYIKGGANLMTIITNDGWWRNTWGHIQHLHYASLRAIETRRDIARSANTGISAFINQRGEITQQTLWWEKAYLSGVVTLNNSITPFVKFGDVVGVASFYLALALILMFLFKRKV